MLSKYGVARHVYITVPKRAVADYAVGADWTPAAGDVKISKDGGAAANVTNLPVAIATGNTAIWDFSLTATEMQAANVVVTVADSATKVVEDQAFIIETYGHASAQHEFDLDTPTVVASSVSALAAGVITAAAIATDAIGSDELAASAISEIQSGLGTAAAQTTMQSDLDDIQTRLPAALVSGRIDASVGAMAANTMTAAAAAADLTTELQTGLATAAALAAVQADTDDLQVSMATAIGGLVAVNADTDDIQTRLPAALVGGRMDASVGAMGAGVVTAAAVATDAIDADALAANAVAEIQAGLATAAAVAAVQADTDDLQTRVPAALVGGRMDASVGAMGANVMTAAAAAADLTAELQTGLATSAGLATAQADLDDIQSRLPAALVGGKIDASVGALGAGAITAASVATGAIDADALATDAVTEIVAAVWAFALTELGATPGAAPTVAAALEFLFMGLRNKVTTTATETKLHNDAGAVVATATVSDNGTTFERSKFA